MRVARAAGRAGGEEGAAEVGGPAAGAGDDPPGRPLERREVRVEDARLVQRLEGAGVVLEVELVARPLLEGPPLVRPDLAGDAVGAQERERAPRDRARSPARGGARCARRRAGARSRRRGRAPRARPAGSRPSAARSPRAPPGRPRTGGRGGRLRARRPPARAGAACTRRRASRSCPEPAGRDDPVARDDEREVVLGAERARGARARGPAGEGGQLAVGDDLAPGNAAQRLGERLLERRPPLGVELDVVEGDALAAEVRQHALGQRMLRAARPSRSPRAGARGRGASRP